MFKFLTTSEKKTERQTFLFFKNKENYASISSVSYLSHILDAIGGHEGDWMSPFPPPCHEYDFSTSFSLLERAFFRRVTLDQTKTLKPDNKEMSDRKVIGVIKFNHSSKTSLRVVGCFGLLLIKKCGYIFLMFTYKPRISYEKRLSFWTLPNLV